MTARKIGRGPSKAAMKATLLPRPDDPSVPKPRDAWFSDRACEAGSSEASGNALLKGWRKSSGLSTATGLGMWEFAGPSNLSGRLTCLAVHPSHPKTIYAGAAGGGVWRSTDAGKNWAPAWSQTFVMQIGALAIDAQSPVTIYCGTGEANRTTGSYNGNGLYGSEDLGDNWFSAGDSDFRGLPRRIGAIAIDPFDSKHILVGGVAVGDDDPAGLFATVDQGHTWRRVLPGTGKRQMCHAVFFHPAQKGIVFAAIEDGNEDGGIWRSDDDGTTWTHLAGGLPSGESVGRIAMAIGTSAPHKLYAIVVNASKRLIGIFRSDNLGDHWVAIHGTEFVKERQLAYNLCIAVHPDDSNTVVCGMTNIHRTTDAGGSWTTLTQSKDTEQDDYVHPDQHALIVLPNGRIYAGNDGGFATSGDGKKWEARNKGLKTAMFYTVDVSPADGRHYGGGCQDIETVVTETGDPDDFESVIGGDGTWLVYGTESPVHIFGSFQQVGIFRHSESENWVPCSPIIPAEERQAVFLTYLAIDPSDTKTVYTGTTRMWRTKDAGVSWSPVSSILDASVITSIAVSPSDPLHVYAGTTAGGFFRSVDGGSSWSTDMAAAPVPRKLISAIAVHPTKPNLVVVTIGLPGFVAEDGSPICHVFLSMNGGEKWLDIDRGELPNMSHTAVEFRTDNPDCIFVASHAGVYLTNDLGQTWRSANLNLPWVPVMDLVYHDKDGTLTAATFGRGLWRMQVRKPGR